MIDLGIYTPASATYTLDGSLQNGDSSYGGTGSSADYQTSNFVADPGLLLVGNACVLGHWKGTLDTDWSKPENWSCGKVPTAASDAFIDDISTTSGNFPNLTLAAACRNITIQPGGILQISGANTLTVTGNWTNNGTFTDNAGTVNFSGITPVINGATNFNNLTLSGSGLVTFNAVPTVNGVFSLEGTSTFSAVPVYGSAATLQYNKPGPFTAGSEWMTPFAPTGGVIISNTGAITINAAKVFNTGVPLTINGGTLITGGNQLTFGGNYINNGGTLTAGSSPIVIAGTMDPQSIAGFTSTGLVSLTKTAGTATFKSNVNGAGLTINGTGGTLNLGVGLSHTFSGTWTRTAGTLDGGSSIINFTAATVSTGTGGTFTPSAGTVAYSLAGAQTAPALTYNNLTLSGSGAKTFYLASPTINGILSLEGTATVSVSYYLFTGPVTYGPNATLQYNTSTLRTATTTEWITPFVATGGVVIANTGAINPGAAVVFNSTAPLTLKSGASLNMSTFLLTLNGNLVNNGATTSGSGGLLITGTSKHRCIYNHRSG